MYSLKINATLANTLIKQQKWKEQTNIVTVCRSWTGLNLLSFFGHCVLKVRKFLLKRQRKKDYENQKSKYNIFFTGRTLKYAFMYFWGMFLISTIIPYLFPTAGAMENSAAENIRSQVSWFLVVSISVTPKKLTSTTAKPLKNQSTILLPQECILYF